MPRNPLPMPPQTQRTSVFLLIYDRTALDALDHPDHVSEDTPVGDDIVALLPPLHRIRIQSGRSSLPTYAIAASLLADPTGYHPLSGRPIGVATLESLSTPTVGYNLPVHNGHGWRLLCWGVWPTLDGRTVRRGTLHTELSASQQRYVRALARAWRISLPA